MGSNLGDDYIRSFSFVELIEKRRLIRNELEQQQCNEARGYSNQPSSSGHVAPSYNIVKNINIDIDIRNTDLRWSEKRWSTTDHPHKKKKVNLLQKTLHMSLNHN